MPPLLRLSRTLFASMFVLLLVGCSETGGGGGGLSGLSGLPGLKAPQTTRLAGLQVNVQGPAGFCIDRSSKVSTASTGFVALGACASISDNPSDAMPPIRAVLTISVSQVTDASQVTPDQLALALNGPNGQATLAHSHRADDVEILETLNVDGALLILVRDTSSSRSSALADKFWRAMFTRNGHLISLTATAVQTHPFAESTGKQLIRQFASQIRQSNPIRENATTGLMATFSNAIRKISE